MRLVIIQAITLCPQPSGITTRNTKPYTRKIIPMREEKLPESISGRKKIPLLMNLWLLRIIQDGSGFSFAGEDGLPHVMIGPDRMKVSAQLVEH